MDGLTPCRQQFWLAKLEIFELEVKARMQVAASLSAKLQSAGIECTPTLLAGNTSMYAQFTIQVENRATVQAALKSQGIPTAVHYPKVLCQQPALAGRGSCSVFCKRSCQQPASVLAVAQ